MRNPCAGHQKKKKNNRKSCREQENEKMDCLCSFAINPSDCISPPPVPNENQQQPPKQRHQKFVRIEKPNWTRLAGQDTTGHNIIWTGKIGPFGRVAFWSESSWAPRNELETLHLVNFPTTINEQETAGRKKRIKSLKSILDRP